MERSNRDLGPHRTTLNQIPSSTTLLKNASPHRYEDEISKRTDLEFTFVQLKKVTAQCLGPSIMALCPCLQLCPTLLDA